ncbi:MAG: hypothetical protein ACYCW6_10740 [Candidatus Xenobia bacterium]
MKYLLAVGCLIMVLGTGTALADAPAPVPSPTPTPSPSPVSPIATNRPSIGDPTTIIAPGQSQIETGADVTTTRGSSVPLYTEFTEYRIGIVKDWEFRLASNMLDIQGNQQGFADAVPGFKWNFGHAKTPLTLVVNEDIPTGTIPFRLAGPSTQVLICADIPAPNNATWSINVGALNQIDTLSNGTRFTELTFDTFYTLPLNAKTSVFGEVNVVGPDAAVNGINEVTLTTGLEYLTSLDDQVDFAFYKGMSVRGLDALLTIGYSHRFR